MNKANKRPRNTNNKSKTIYSKWINQQYLKLRTEHRYQVRHGTHTIIQPFEKNRQKKTPEQQQQQRKIYCSIEGRSYSWAMAHMISVQIVVSLTWLNSSHRNDLDQVYSMHFVMPGRAPQTQQWHRQNSFEMGENYLENPTLTTSHQCRAPYGNLLIWLSLDFEKPNYTFRAVVWLAIYGTQQI